MKTWIRRTLIGLAAAGALFGGLAAWGHQHFRGWQSGDSAERRTQMVEFASKRLELDATQRAKLEVLADTLQAQRKALVADGSPHAELNGLIAGPVFDRTKASALLQRATSQVQLQSPAVINAFGDFYDSLRAEQQSKLRDTLAQRHRGRQG